MVERRSGCLGECVREQEGQRQRVLDGGARGSRRRVRQRGEREPSKDVVEATAPRDDTIVSVGADCTTRFWLVKDNSKRKQKDGMVPSNR